MNTKEAENILSLLDRVIIMLGIGSALLGTRKISGVIGSKNNAEGIQRAVEDALNAREEKEEKMRTKILRETSVTNPEGPIND